MTSQNLNIFVNKRNNNNNNFRPIPEKIVQGLSTD